ncbi:MAG: hypothetical protein DI539_25695 [Flavobacterium psychrophilum]|nr:MAG: hypothetical protein DI539_25695 [Flavobacterium psychrophilum]
MNFGSSQLRVLATQTYNYLFFSKVLFELLISGDLACNANLLSYVKNWNTDLNKHYQSYHMVAGFIHGR